MTKHVPALDKALRILSELAARPTESLTLSALARAAEINLSTCHSIVMALTEASYLLRHEQAKTYSLGPALVEIGTAALHQYLGLPAAREAAEELSRRFDLATVVGGRAGDELIVLAHAASSRVTPDTRQGFRGPMVPPLGRLFMAWVPENEVQEWLRRLNLPDDSEEVRYYRDALKVTQEQGYIVSLDGTISELAIRLAVQLARATTQHDRLDMAVKLADLLRNEEYAHLGQANGIIHRQDVIGAPVFGPDDRVALTLSVIGRPGDIAEPNVPTIVRALTAATRRITASIGGRTPARPPRDDLPRRPDAA